MPEKPVFRLPLSGRQKTNFQACKFSITCWKSENTRSLAPNSKLYTVIGHMTDTHRVLSLIVALIYRTHNEHKKLTRDTDRGASHCSSTVHKNYIRTYYLFYKTGNFLQILILFCDDLN